MQNFITKLLVVILSSTLVACSGSSKNQYNFSRPSYDLSCPELKRTLRDLEYQKSTVKKDDGFRFKYMLVIPSIWKVMTMNKQNDQLDSEISRTKSLISSKDCNKPKISKKKKIKKNRSGYYNPYINNISYDQMGYYGFNYGNYSPENSVEEEVIEEENTEDESAIMSLQNEINYQSIMRQQFPGW